MLLHFVFYNSMNHHHHFIFYLSKITFRLILQNFNYPKNEYLDLIQIILCVFSQDLNLSFFISSAGSLKKVYKRVEGRKRRFRANRHDCDKLKTC